MLTCTEVLDLNVQGGPRQPIAVGLLRSRVDPEFAFCFINLLFEIGAVGVLLAIGFARQSGFPAELEATCSRISDRPTLFYGERL